MDPRKIFGLRGEQVAERYLQRKGYCILARNVRFARGEIDLVALQGETLVFCEVKSRRGGRELQPGESIDTRKQMRLIRLATEYVQQNPRYADISCRFDAVLVWKTGPFWQVDLITDAFSPGW